MKLSQFWENVDKTSHPGGCWLWKLRPNQRCGYGRVHMGRERMLAHRVAWLLTHGDPGPLCVLHRCDNTKCVNPEHLFLGTVTDNNADKIAKGRQTRGHGALFCGEKHGATHLTEADVLAMRESCAAGVSQKALTEKYRLSAMAVSLIVRGVTWAHVGGPRQQSRSPGPRPQRARKLGTFQVLDLTPEKERCARRTPSPQPQET